MEVWAVAVAHHDKRSAAAKLGNGIEFGFMGIGLCFRFIFC
jgi:hypothetical protein